MFDCSKKLQYTSNLLEKGLLEIFITLIKYNISNMREYLRFLKIITK
jgi:hypothetical protein